MAKKTAFAVVALVAASVAGKVPTAEQLTDAYSFEQYNRDFSKGHISGTLEYTKREKLFVARRAEVIAHNAAGHGYKKGINQLSDRTDKELRRMRGNKMSMKGRYQPERTHQVSGAPVPHSFDWRQVHPAVLTGVKNQGQCGSCWAHAATETAEAHWALATGNLFVLSQQQVTSCTPTPNDCGGTGGCSGAIAESAWKYITEAGGQTEEWQWGYTSFFGNSGKCSARPPSARPVVKLSGYTKVAHNDAAAVLDAVAHAGPLAISVDASAWSSYESGIFDGCDYARNISMDHAVQLVGYGTDKALGKDYWLVRNSWSGSWGEEGYIRLLRRKKTECGWNVNPQSGSGCKNQTAPQWACGMCGIAFDTLYPNPQV